MLHHLFNPEIVCKSFEINNLFAVLLSYFIGSIPSAMKVNGFWKMLDYGSNNAGATNTFRVIGKTAGFMVYLLIF